MGATNTTTYYNLSQFIGTDKPAWLQDYNGDMLKIDTAINTAKIAADNAANAASAAQGDATTALGEISTLNTTLSTVVSSLNTAIGNINTINSLLGNGTPTTTDQTVIGAINELHADVISDETRITNIEDAIKSNYVMFDESSHTFSVTGTTIKEALNACADHILAFIQGLDDDVYVEVLNFKFGGLGTQFETANATLYSNATTTFAMVGNSLSYGSNVASMTGIRLWSGSNNVNNNFCKSCTLHDNQYPATVDLDLSDLTGLTNFGFDMRIWKKIPNFS